MTGDETLQFLEHLRHNDHLTKTAGNGERAERGGYRSQGKLWELTSLSASEFADEAARFSRLDRISLQDMLSPASLCASFAQRFLREMMVFPCQSAAGGAVLAVPDPTDTAVRRAAEIALRTDVAITVASVEDIKIVLDQRLGSDDVEPESGSEVYQPREDDIESLRDLASGAPVVRAVNDLLEKAVELRASDIHIEPFHAGCEHYRGAGGRVKPRKICLFGMFGGGNFGNDASLESFLLFLREARPDAELSCICVDPETIGREHHIATTPISAPDFSNPFLRLCNKLSLRMIGRLANWVRAIRYVRQFDIIIVPGTSTLNDYGSGPLGTSYGLYRWAAAARLCGVKFCFVGTGAGPILHPLSRWMLKSAAAWAHFRSFRDQASKDFLASLGIDTSMEQVYPDLVFRLPTPVPTQATAQENPITIGVGLMNYNGWRAGARTSSDPAIYQTYIETMGSFVNGLLDRGFRVRLLTGETVDVRAVNDIGRIAQENGYELIDGPLPSPKAQQLVTEPIHSLHDIMRQINETEIVVATRFHNVVCALKLARPTVSIGYEPKNDAVMADMGLAEFCQNVDDLDLELLERQFKELLENKQQYQGIIRQRLDDAKSRVKQHEQKLLSTIL